MSSPQHTALAARYASALLTYGLTELEYGALDTDVLDKLTILIGPNQKLSTFAEMQAALHSIAKNVQSDIISHNVKLLCEVYRVSIESAGLIEYIIALSASSELKELVDELQFCDLIGSVKRALMAHFKVDEDTCYSQLDALASNGLIRSATLTNSCDLILPESQVRLLTRSKLTSAEAYLRHLLSASPSAAFTLKDFSHLDTETLQQYLQSAVRQRLRGVNILIYGDAGTGKTELARALAKSLSRTLYETKTMDSTGKQLEERYDVMSQSRLRMQYLSSMQALLGSHTQSMFLIDECESIFMDSDEYYAKDTLHRLLEMNPNPCIWITNHIQYLEHSFIRRFKLVQEVNAIEGKYIEPLAKQAFRGLRIKQPYIDKLLTTANITPAHIGNAAHVAKTINLTSQSAQEVVSEVIQSTLSASDLLATPLRYKPEMAFDASLLNIKQGKETIKQINAALAQHAPIRILLSGEPGTGKTAFAHHLAKQHDFNLVSVRCSDVLSKYIGESESNIANIFYDAQQHGNALLLDEVDSLLVSRERVTEQHNIQLINELLTQIECFEQPVFAATNYATLLDKAVLRRFDFKIEALCLTHEQRITLFKRVLSLKQLTQFEQQQLSTLTQLTAGDFAIVARRMRFQPDGDFRQQALALLIEENRHKQPNHPIGFVSKPH
ncbi:AAA family ATPase [Paraglaciecola chathamensis]|uniref:AAA family ATPase n=1 Tax=Paraglaciecola chathamensis TaxID=368405 RepID=A0ABS0WHG3_9ALTE|nr:AAA family ATPase [Paraglaciecola chathamensis]MBJ2137919.1 AAA family ATPase [Paraglaciecola chathamensis]